MGWPAGNVAYLEVRPDDGDWTVVRTNNSRGHFPKDDRVKERFETQSEAFEWAKHEVQVEPFGLVTVKGTDGELTRAWWPPRHRRVELRPIAGVEAEKYRRRLERHNRDPGREPYWGVYTRDESGNDTHYDKVWTKPTKSEAVDDIKSGARSQLIRKVVIRDSEGDVQETWTHPIARKLD